MAPSAKVPTVTTTRDDLDPKGDVILIVSRPTHPRSYLPTGSVCPDSASNGQESVSPIPPESPTAGQSLPYAHKFKFTASSRHLSLASRYLEEKLRRRLSEDEAWEKPEVELDLGTVDLEAFRTILAIIHGRTRRVPRRINLDQLVELAVLVNRFKCLETVDTFGQIWIEGLKHHISTSFSSQTVKWIFVSWAFQHEEIFTTVTRTAEIKGRSDMDTLGLPIPVAIKNDIDKKRKQGLEKLVAVVKERQKELEDTDSCDDCSAALLGALIKQMKDIGLYPTIPPEFFGFVFDDTMTKVSGFKPMVRHSHNCSVYCNGIISPKTRDHLKDAERCVVGLKLHTFLGPS